VRGIVWHKTEELTVGWREWRISSTVICSYSSLNIVRVISSQGLCDWWLRSTRDKTFIHIFVRKSEEKIRLQDRRLRWQDDIKMDFKEIKLRECGLESSSTVWRLLSGSCERKDECWDPIKSGEFRDGLIASVIPEEGLYFLNLISLHFYRSTKKSLANWKYVLPPKYKLRWSANASVSLLHTKYWANKTVVYLVRSWLSGRGCGVISRLHGVYLVVSWLNDSRCGMVTTMGGSLSTLVKG
jgi:hypothetical protein